MGIKGFFTSRIGKIILIFLPVIIIAAFVVLFILPKKSIKKELLASIYVTPNDTSESVLKYKEELSIKLPKGLIKTPDSLKIFNVENIEKPEFSEGVIKTYDIGFKKTNEFNQDVKIEFSYSEILNSDKNLKPENLCIMYYDEKENKWINEIAARDETNKKFILLTNHFSDRGFVNKGNTLASPCMYIWDVPYPANIKTGPDAARAFRVLKSFELEKKPNTAETIELGLNIFQSIVEHEFSALEYINYIKELPVYNEIENLGGPLGIVFSLKEIAFKLYYGKYDELNIYLFKEMLNWSLIRWGGEAMSIAMVGVLMLDQALTALGEKKNEVLDNRYQNAIDNNSFRKTDGWWLDFVKNTIMAGGDMKKIINDEIEMYLKQIPKDEFCYQIIPDGEMQKMIQNEKIRIHELINKNMSKINEDIYYARLDEANKLMTKMADEMNKLTNINVWVEPSSPDEKDEIKNLPVRVVVSKDQKKWEGKTDERGYWSLLLTYHGYSYYKNPKTVELEYDGQVLKQDFKLEKNGATVKFKLPSKKKKDECDVPKGTYKGTIELNSKEKPKGQLEIILTDKENISFKTLLKGTITDEANFTRIDVEHNIDAKGKVIIFKGYCVIFFEGTRVQNETYTNTRYGTSTKHSSSTKWGYYGKFESNKIVNHKELEKELIKNQNVIGLYSFEAIKTN